jgi:hypothetical protein
MIELRCSVLCAEKQDFGHGGLARLFEVPAV